jgi:hypothetical protein
MLVLLVLVEETFSAIERADRSIAKVNSIMLLSCQKILVFFLQTTIVLNVELWPKGGWKNAKWVKHGQNKKMEVVSQKFSFSSCLLFNSLTWNCEV